MAEKKLFVKMLTLHTMEREAPCEPIQVKSILLGIFGNNEDMQRAGDKACKKYDMKVSHISTDIIEVNKLLDEAE